MFGTVGRTGGGTPGALLGQIGWDSLKASKFVLAVPMLYGFHSALAVAA